MKRFLIELAKLLVCSAAGVLYVVIVMIITQV